MMSCCTRAETIVSTAPVSSVTKVLTMAGIPSGDRFGMMRILTARTML
jgi:hypothetical protein